MSARYTSVAKDLIHRTSSTRGVAKKGTAPSLPVPANGPLALLESVERITCSVTDYLKVAQQETTKRADIAARRDVALEAIRSQRALISECIARTFDERAAVIGKQFEVLDRALDSENIAVVDAALRSMVSVVQASPFRSVVEMQKAMCSDDFVIRLD